MILDSNKPNKCALTCFLPLVFASECSLSRGFVIELEWDKELESILEHLWFIISRIQDGMSNDTPASLCKYIN